MELVPFHSNWCLQILYEIPKKNISGIFVGPKKIGAFRCFFLHQISGWSFSPSKNAPWGCSAACLLPRPPARLGTIAWGRKETLHGSEIRRTPVEVDSLSHYFMFHTCQVVFSPDFWTTNSTSRNLVSGDFSSNWAIYYKSLTWMFQAILTTRR